MWTDDGTDEERHSLGEFGFLSCLLQFRGKERKKERKKESVSVCVC
jgi:hypothetical protein